MDETVRVGQSPALFGQVRPRWNRRDICEAYAALFFISAIRAAHVRKCGRESYVQLKRIASLAGDPRYRLLGFDPVRRSSVLDLTPNGLAIFATAHMRERGNPIDCPVCNEHTLRYPCPYT